MGRMTKRSDFTGLVLIDGKGYGEAYFDAKEDFDRITKALNKLAAYEDAEEQGRLVILPEPTPDIDFVRIFNLIMADAEDRVIVLPCKVGDTVWFIRPLKQKPKIEEAVVEKIGVRKRGMYLKLSCNSMYETAASSIGKSVFLSREEAEKALEEMNNG